MIAKKYLIVVGGPTASGKTSTAIALARHYDTVILSADSRQFYQEMSIGTAKPDEDELAAAQHYFVDSHSIASTYSVGDYETEALDLLRKLYQEKDIIILVGGSGLYINALCQGLDTFPEVPLPIRDAYEKMYEQQGIELLQNELKAVDPEYAQRVDMQNPHRLIRALSVQKVSGAPFSSFLRKQADQRFFTPIYLQMFWERAALYDRINRRVDLMIEQGLEDEVKSLMAYPAQAALATVGYQEWFAFFEGKTDKATVIDLIKRNSRRYAKRQLTWMRRDGFWKKFRPAQVEEIIRYTDWMMVNHFALVTDSNGDDKKIQYIYEGEEIASLLVKVNKSYAFAKVEKATAVSALNYLVDEYGKIALGKDQFLIIPPFIELSAEEMGFHHKVDAAQLPEPVSGLCRAGETLLLKRSSGN